LAADACPVPHHHGGWGLDLVGGITVADPLVTFVLYR
jgi:hypothetical protein